MDLSQQQEFRRAVRAMMLTPIVDDDFPEVLGRADGLSRSLDFTGAPQGLQALRLVYETWRNTPLTTPLWSKWATAVENVLAALEDEVQKPGAIS